MNPNIYELSKMTKEQYDFIMKRAELDITEQMKVAKEVSDDVKARNKAIPWRIIKDTRNFYVHAYGAIDIPSVWDTLLHDIPALKTACEAILTHV